jgi:hypothetical protein
VTWTLLLPLESGGFGRGENWEANRGWPPAGAALSLWILIRSVKYRLITTLITLIEVNLRDKSIKSN